MILFDLNHIFSDPVASQHKGLVNLLRDFPADVIHRRRFPPWNDAYASWPPEGSSGGCPLQHELPDVETR